MLVVTGRLPAGGGDAVVWVLLPDVAVDLRLEPVEVEEAETSSE